MKIKFVGGKRPKKVHVNVHIGPRAGSQEKPLLDHGKNPSRHECSRGQRGQPVTGNDTPDHSTER